MQIPLSPPPGINSDHSTFAVTGRWADGDGFRFRLGKPETIGGAIEVASATPVVRANKLLVFDLNGTINLAVAGDTLRIGAIDGPGSDITPFTDWTTGAGIRRCLQMFGDVLLASVSGGKLFESAAGGQATEVTNAPDKITCMITTPTRQVMALGCSEEGSGTFNPRCIRWCDIEDYSDWTSSASNNAGEHILSGQADIISGCVFGDYIIVWTEGDMWIGQFIGDPDQTFSWVRVGDVGIAGLDAFAIYKHTLYWMAPDRGVYAYAVGAIPQRVACPLQNEFPAVASANPAIHACAIPRFGEVWFGVPVGSTQPGHYFVYCVDESAVAQLPVWYRGSFGTAMSGLGAGAMVDSPLLVDNLAPFRTTTIVHACEPLAQKPWLWDCQSSSTFFNFGISGAYIQSADFYMDQGERRVMVRSVVPDFEIQSGAVYLTAFTRDRPMAEPNIQGPYTLATSTQLANCLTNGTIASGGSAVSVDTNPEPMAAGVVFTFNGINAWDGGDTGELAEFTVESDFIGGNGTVNFAPAIVSSGAGRNVVGLPANNTPVVARTRRSKKDFRASGKLFAFRFTTSGAFRVRFGTPLFDVVELGER